MYVFNNLRKTSDERTWITPFQGSVLMSKIPQETLCLANRSVVFSRYLGLEARHSWLRNNIIGHTIESYVSYCFIWRRVCHCCCCCFVFCCCYFIYYHFCLLCHCYFKAIGPSACWFSNRNIRCVIHSSIKATCTAFNIYNILSYGDIVTVFRLPVCLMILTVWRFSRYTGLW